MLRKKIRDFVNPIIALIKLMPYLWQVRNEKDFYSISHSYLGWMPLCIFTDPQEWVKMLLSSPRRYQNGYQRPYSFYVPSLSANPFAQKDEIAELLEANIEQIRDEFFKIANRGIVTPSKSLVEQGNWTTFPLMRAAKTLEDNIKLCPVTWSVVQKCSLLWGVRGGVYFSILTPGTHIKSHCGPSNLKLRYHLTIQEEPKAKIRSGTIWKSWSQGQCLILDDSFEHEVIHDGENQRVVLIVDCWHPDLNDKDKEFLVNIHQIWRGK